jgi:uncharacterized radical SAM superfamily Fe-S cluster-containing enzyme
MLRPLWIKFTLLLLAVAFLALMSSFFLRAFIIGEFRHFREGETEDRVYWVSADLEGCYEKHGGWNREVIAEDAVWALMLGMETRVVDGGGKVVMDTATALDSLPPLRKARVLSMSGIDGARQGGEFVPYPLFLAGREIGWLEVRFLPFGKEELFVRRSNRFLILSSLLVGGMAVILSIIFARKFTGPIRKLAAAAEAVRQKGKPGQIYLLLATAMALLDLHGRSINYLRLSVTDRCNLRCRYCMPATGMVKAAHDDILSYDGLLRIARAAIAIGVEKIRVTGGEPLVRRGITDFLRQLAAIPGLQRLVLTSNGVLLP